MTLPDERYRSLQHAALFLQQLCNPAVTKRIPKEIRQEAARVLRHFPSSWDLQQLERRAPDIIQQRMEPLHRMIVQYSNEDLRSAAADDHEGSTLD